MTSVTPNVVHVHVYQATPCMVLVIIMFIAMEEMRAGKLFYDNIRGSMDKPVIRRSAGSMSGGRLRGGCSGGAVSIMCLAPRNGARRLVAGRCGGSTRTTRRSCASHSLALAPSASTFSRDMARVTSIVLIRCGLHSASGFSLHLT